jgi:hypothetical protein
MLFRRRPLSAVLTIAALAIGSAALASCSHSHPSGGGVDATGDDGDGGGDDGDGGDGDASALDASGDGAGNDGSTIDARVIDGSGPDAATDAPTDSNGCINQPCDYQAPQCGCAAPLVCDIDFTDLVGSSCRAVTQNGTAQSTCAGFGECGMGFTCLNAGGGRRCEQFCEEDAQCPQPRGRCIIQVKTPQGADVVGATTCSSNCNPLSTTLGGACPANWKCGFFTIDQTDFVDCGIPGVGTHGSACNTDADCGAGTMCSTYNNVKACRRVCNKTAGGQECATVNGTTCLGFLPALNVAGTEYGICAQ